MQTFLPSSDYLWSAMLLDNKRLNKQILEAYQILKVLSTNGKAWRNHPAVLMWEEHENELFLYANAMVKEARIRGIKVDKNLANLEELKAKYGSAWGEGKPEWFNNESINYIIATHRANLYRKDPEYYSDWSKYVDNKWNKPCCPTCSYFWVTHPRKEK
jgi:hypothetical protein